MITGLRMAIGAWLLLSGLSWAAVQLGSDTLAESGFAVLRGKRVGLITNPSGVNCRQQSTLDVLRRTRGVKLVAVFGAEHGLYGTAKAGEEVKDCMDVRIGLPVYSLYGPGPVRKPTPAMLKNLDVLVYDIQDTGCRSYTYISTMGLAMEACAEAGVEFVVLDRPNPLGGERVEGPMLDSRFRSFVGQWAIPYVYGLTCGELARMINGEGWIRKRCKLTVVRMKGWQRDMAWQHTGLKWIPTSPHIPRSESPLHYVSTGLLGAIGGVNIGMSYNLPFQCVTAPWLDDHRLAGQLERFRLPGVTFRPLRVPGNNAIQKGVLLSFSDPVHAPLMALNFYVLEAVKATTGRNLFAEAVKAGKSFDLFDKVNGTDQTRRALEANLTAENITRSWQANGEAFKKRRQKYLLY